MKYIIAPDSFKGSISAEEFCDCAVKVIGERQPAAKIVCMPLADGGEGTVDTVLRVKRGKYLPCTVNGASGEKLCAGIGLLDNGRTAIVEAAKALGLPIKKSGCNPENASSTGLGQMISFAASKGVNSIIIAAGGTSVNDCGMGMLSAMGVRFTDFGGNTVTPSGASMSRVMHIELLHEFEKYRNIHFTLMSDVFNPLLGENGAAAVFAPQKGADSAMVNRLERGAASFADVVRRVMLNDFRNVPGSGCAGGIGFAAASFLDAKIQSGAEAVLDMYGFEKELKGADKVISGEGRFDEQSLMGKAVGTVIRRSGSVPCTVFCGTNAVKQCGGAEIIEISAGMEPEQAMTSGVKNLIQAMETYF